MIIQTGKAIKNKDPKHIGTVSRPKNSQYRQEQGQRKTHRRFQDKANGEAKGNSLSWII